MTNSRATWRYSSYRILCVAVVTSGAFGAEFPAPTSLTPAVSSGANQVLTIVYNLPTGFQTLNVANVLINTTLDGRQACYLAYSLPSNALYIVADNGDATQISGKAVNGTGTVGNSQCSVALAGSSASGSGNTFTLVLNLSFSSSFSGNKVVYAAAGDLSGNNSGWQTMGVVGVPPPPSTFPNPIGMSPSWGNTSTQTIVFTYEDQSAATNLQTVWVLINTAIDGHGACYAAYYRPGNQLYLYPDSGDGTQATSIVLPGNNSIKNSQCAISARGANAQTDGNMLRLTLPITFTPAFGGFKGVWLAAQTLGGVQTSPWQALGAEALPAPPQFISTWMEGGGVTGSPATGPAAYLAGASAAYSYAPAAGFTSAVVEVDGDPSPASGNITMNSDHWIWAWGQPATGTDFAGFITAPNNPAIIPYPQFFSHRPTSQTVRVTDPYCGATSQVIAYPENALGVFPMPAVAGAPLPASVLRGVAILDIWGCCLNRPALNYGCSGSMHASFTETLARIKRLGGDHVVVTTYPFVIDASAAVPVLDVANQQISDAELEFIAGAARAAGLDVWLFINIPSNDEMGAALPSQPKAPWFSGFLDAYGQYIAGEARAAQTNGVKAILFGWLDYYLDVTPYLASYVPKMTAALAQVRAAFQGTVIFNDVELGFAVYSAAAAVAPLYSGVDAILPSMNPDALTPAQSANVTVALMKQQFQQRFAIESGILDLVGKHLPLVVLGAPQSNLASLVTGFVDDTWACPKSCATLPADFSVQAIAYEALLEVTVESGLPILAFETNGYWPTDVMLPKDTYPNIGRTVRNKPAEVILQRWFQR